MKKDKGISTTVIGVIVIAAIIVGIGAALMYMPGEEETSENEEPIDLGAMLSLSGSLSLIGEKEKRGILLAENDINEGVGTWEQEGVLGKEVNFVFKDTEGDPQAAISKLQSLSLEENVNLSCGMISSLTNKAVQSKLPEYNHVFLGHGTSKKLTGEWFPQSEGWYFRAGGISSVQLGRTLGTIIAQEYPNAESVISLGQDYYYGYNMWEQIQVVLDEEKPNMTEYDPIYVQLGTREYGAIISKIMDKDPDVLALTLAGGDLNAFLKQAKSRGLFEEVDMASTSLGATILGSLGEDAPKGQYASASCKSILFPKNETMKNWRDRYYERFGEWPNHAAMGTYASAMALATAIDKAGTTDPEQVKNTLEGMTYEVPFATVNIREVDHQGVFDQYVYGKIAQVDELNQVYYNDLTPVSGEKLVRSEEEVGTIHENAQ